MINSSPSNYKPISFYGGNNSDSGESIGGNRSESNATPPMHFLTPHVEISMTEPTPNECLTFSSQVSVFFNS